MKEKRLDQLYKSHLILGWVTLLSIVPVIIHYLITYGDHPLIHYLENSDLASVLNTFPDVVDILINATYFIVCILTIAVAVLLIYAGNCIKHRKKRISTLVSASSYCVLFPLGTILAGITTYYLLSPPIVKLYNAAKRKDSSPS